MQSEHWEVLIEYYDAWTPSALTEHKTVDSMLGKVRWARQDQLVNKRRIKRITWKHVEVLGSAEFADPYK